MDELKRYPPTARRLARLQREGISPDTTALSGAAVLVAATVALIMLGPQLLQLARVILAWDLQHGATGMPDAAGLRSILGLHLTVGAIVIIALGGAAAVVGAMARSLQTGATKPGESAGLMLKGLRRPKGGGVQWPGLVLGTAALAGGAVVVAALLGAWGRAESWQELWTWPALAQAWGRWLAVLVGMALLHLLWTRTEYLQQARLSHRELVEEQKEAEGPGLTKGRARRRRSS